MDPFSITGGCASLVVTIEKLSTSLSTFAMSIRSARRNLAAVFRELLSFKTLLELLNTDTKDLGAFPETLREQIVGIVANCELVFGEIEGLLKKYEGLSVCRTSKWTLSGSDGVKKLRLCLEMHKSALELALDMVWL
jgi:hypothetical protein